MNIKCSLMAGFACNTKIDFLDCWYSKPFIMQTITKPTLIEKELINSLSFKSREPVEQHPKLTEQISSATRLGNGYRGKVTIVFEDDEGLKRVDTTIWASGAKYICLKGGMWLPINRIVEIKP